MPDSIQEDKGAPIGELRAAISGLEKVVTESHRANLRDISLASGQLALIGKRSGTPDADDLLIEAMLCNKLEEVRDTARLALAERKGERVAKAFRLESILTEFSNCHYLPYGDVVNKPKDPDALADELKTMVHDPIFVERMIGYVLSRRSFSDQVALAIRETPLPEKQASIRAMIESEIGSQWEFSARGKMQYLPCALDPALPANRDLLIRVLSEGQKSFDGNFERAVILTLSESSAPEVLSFLESRLFSNETFRPAEAASVAEAIGNNLNEKNSERLIELARGNMLRTAWFMAGFGNAAGARRIWGMLRLLCNSTAITRKKVEAALAITDCCPELAREILTKIDNGRGEAERRCRTDLGFYISRGLARLPQAVS